MISTRKEKERNLLELIGSDKKDIAVTKYYTSIFTNFNYTHIKLADREGT